MGAAPIGWTVTFGGCEDAQHLCDAARFEVMPSQGAGVAVEVGTTARIKYVLARELGKEALEAGDRKAIVSVAGCQLIEKCLTEEGAVEPLLFLDSRPFRVASAERRLARECGPLSG